MRQFPNTLIQIIEKSGLKLNTISKTSGVSNAYLRKLNQGDINRPGKDKIACIMLCLNYSIHEINQILAEYDYGPLNRHDIPDILENNRKRKFEGNTLAHYDNIYVELLLSPMEQLGGTKILVKDRPSGILKPIELYLKYDYTFEKDGVAKDFLYDLNLAVLKERKNLFLKNCDHGCRIETYICKPCLQEYLKKMLIPSDKPDRQRDRELVVRYFANAISLISRNPDQHQTFIMERCPYFHFQIQDADGENPIVSFPGHKAHHFDQDYEQMNLQGFTSDSPGMIALFKKEIAFCRKAIDPSIHRDYPHHFIEYILACFRTFDLDQLLEQEIHRAGSGLI